MEFDDSGTCNTSLGLGMIIHRPTVLAQADDHQQNINSYKELFLKYDPLLPSLSLGRSENKLKSAAKKNQQASSMSALSPSISNSRGSSDHEDENSSPRKKLRLTKQQFATLEETFEEHNTLNPKQKQALAEKLNLRPRQVEVWFQNRRARNKLKQSEVDCDLRKRCCETLTEENKRLQREVQELKSVKLYMQLPVATLTTMCPSCERLGSAIAGDGGGGGDGDGDDSSFTFVSKPLYNSLAHSSAASC